MGTPVRMGRLGVMWILVGVGTFFLTRFPGTLCCNKDLV